MLGLVSGIITLCGIALLATVVLNAIDKEGKYAKTSQTVMIYCAKISGTLLGIYVILVNYQITGGIWSFSTIGLYSACSVIIYSQLRDLLGGAELAANLAIIAQKKAATLGKSIEKAAAEAREETSATNETEK